MVTSIKAIKLSADQKDALIEQQANTGVAYEAAKRAAERAALELAEAEDAYVQAALRAKANGVNTKGIAFISNAGIPSTVTFVDGTGGNSHVDDAALAKKIGVRKFNAICKQVIDGEKLKAAIASGVISAADVAMVTKVGDRKHYGRFTAKVAKAAPRKVAPRRVA